MEKIKIDVKFVHSLSTFCCFDYEYIFRGYITHVPKVNTSTYRLEKIEKMLALST